MRAYLPADHPNKALEIGTEDTPDAYVARLVDVFREVKRVLHPSGTLWLNLGSSYNGSGGAGGDYAEGGLKEGQPKYPGRNLSNYKPKDLILIPAMAAIALQRDGWWLRQEIIWNKLAPMPESVTDRCTKAHEQVFLLAKSATYFYDHVAIMEPHADPHRTNFAHGAKLDASRHDTDRMDFGRKENGRNKRSVWTLGPEPSHLAHFATMPTKLVEPCVLAGTSQYGACEKCLAPWERVVEREMPPLRKVTTNGPVGGHGLLGGNRFDEPIKTTTVGWQPTCTCNAAVIPCTVLDPFSGSGTTLAVALKFGRRAIGIDLDGRNLEMARTRIEQMQPMLLAVTA